jgi:hypothetical protein
MNWWAVAMPRARNFSVGALMVGAVCLSGCAQIVVISDDEPPRTEWKFGVLVIDLAPSSKNTIVSSSGIGIVSTPGGATLGYANARIVRIGDACCIVIAAKDFETLRNDAETLRLLASVGKACAA